MECFANGTVKTYYTYKFRLYPNKEQERKLRFFVYCVKFIYNRILELSKENFEKFGEKWNKFKYVKLIPFLKGQYPFLKEACSQSLIHAVFNLDRAYKRFFMRKSKFPRPKKEDRHDGAFCVSEKHFKLEIKNNKWGYLKLPKIKKPIKLRCHRKIEGDIKSLTIKITPSGEFYAMIKVEKWIQQLPRTDKIVAIDLGVKDYATLVYNIEKSEGIPNPNCKRIENPVYSKEANPMYLIESEKRLKKLQQKLSKKKESSKNFAKLSKIIAKLHEKIKRQRTDFLHKLSTKIINENQVIILEGISVKDMLQDKDNKNSKLPKRIHDSGWGMFRRFLEYKAEWYGRKIVIVDRFFPSTKKCSVCGNEIDELPLNVRIWTCKCGKVHDRDVNAGLNLLNYYLESSVQQV